MEELTVNPAGDGNAAGFRSFLVHLPDELVSIGHGYPQLLGHFISVPDIDSYVGLMHTLFTLEDNYGLKISEIDGEVCLKVDVRKNKDAARLHEMLCSWQQAAAMLEAGEISKEDYDKWRYHYPEFDVTQKRTKVMSQGLSDLLVDEIKKGE